MRLPSFLAVTLLGAACGDPPDAGRQPAATQAPGPLEHDFGVIPHGQSRHHDFVLDLPQLGSAFVPLHVQLDCSCGRGQLLRRRADGSEQPIDGRPVADNLPAAGDTVIARVILDTADREAVDLPHTASHGYVLLQAVADRAGANRVRWPLLLRFGVDAPVELQPFAELDFGRVPACAPAERTTSLRGDANHPGMRFLRTAVSDAHLDATLTPGDGFVDLRVRCRPGELGNHRAVVSIETDLPDYVVHVPVTWKVVPDLEATPMAKISFRTDLRHEQSEGDATGQFVLVTDHDTGRAPEFVVHELVDGDGRDAAGRFVVTLTPVPGQSRQQRLHVRYRGGLADGFRGRLVLGKAGADQPTLAIDLVVFPTRDS